MLDNQDKRILVFDARIGALLKEIESEAPQNMALAMSPDGLRVAWLAVIPDEAPSLMVADLMSGDIEAVLLLTEPVGDWTPPLVSMYFSADGNSLILGGQYVRSSRGPTPAPNPIYIVPIPA